MPSLSLLRRTVLAAVPLIVLLAACSGGGGGGGGSKPTLGTATVLPGPCPSGPGTLPGAACQMLRIEGLGNAPLDVELRIVDPVGVPLRGTILTAAGGTGVDFYADLAGGELLLQDLLALGFRIVDRKWQAGWFESGTSVKDQSARFATLLRWVHDNAHTTGAFVALGNSAGSGEIGYALTTWDAADLLDAAILASGPPMSRLDFLMQNPPSPAWTTQCAALVPPGTLECGVPACTAEPGNPLSPILPPGITPDELETDSILHPAAEVDFPATPVSVLVGAADCQSSVPMAVLFHDTVTSPKSIEVVPGTPHTLCATQAGRDAIGNAVIASTPVPATRGRSLQLRLTEMREEEGSVLVIEGER